MDFTIRPATAHDAPHLPLIEWTADQLYRQHHLGLVADQPIKSQDAYLAAINRGNLWVACVQSPYNAIYGRTASASAPVAFISIELHASSRAAYVTQLSVHPSVGRHGAGRSLVAQVEQWARSQMLLSVELTTFRDVMFNRPYYERLGYRVLAELELQRQDAIELKMRIERERQNAVLGRWYRVGMRKALWAQ